MTANHPCPPFVLGITGNLDPLPETPDAGFDTLKQNLRLLLRFIRLGARHRDPAATRRQSLWQSVCERLPMDNTAPRRLNGYAQGLERWPGIDAHTPIILLSSLAPGADSLAAEVVTEPEFQKLGFTLHCPLPFPAELYVQSSSFGGDQAKIDHFEQLIAKASDSFPVYLQTDLATYGLDPAGAAALHQQFQTDLAVSARRNQRYQAAGEYIAATSHLLIAIDDDDYSVSTGVGANAIIEVKRRGLTPGLLPSSGAFNWGDTGTVLHLYHRRHKSEAAQKPLQPTRGTAVLRILQPYDCGPADPDLRAKLAYVWTLDDADDRNAYRSWQEAGNSLLTRNAENLNHFSKIKVKPSEATELEGLCKAQGHPLDGDAKTHAEKLRPLSAVRRRSADESSTLRKRTDITHAALFWLTLAAAFCLHLFAHWEPQEHQDTATHTVASQHAVPPAVGETHPADPPPAANDPPTAHTPISASAPAAASHHGPGLRPWFAVTALALGFFGLFVFWWHHSRRIEQRDYDYRALSEGLRVQFFWSLGGIREPVAGNYMQHQSSELDWIRNAIASLTHPAHRWQEGFLRLPRAAQRRLFEVIRDSWVNDQLHYFKNTRDKDLHALHFWHTLGGVLALAGLFHVPALLYAVIAPLPSEQLVIGAALAAIGVTLLLFVLLYNHLRHGHVTHGTRLAKFVHRLVPHLAEHTRQAHRGWKLAVHSLCTFFRHVLPALALALLSLAGVLVSTALLRWLPGPLNLGIIVMGLLFIGGALAVAWAEKNLYSEYAYQYDAMHELFAKARLRLDDYLAELIKVVHSNPSAFDEIRARIQELLLQLGQEALNENADWLILHRARPMEPVMAG